MIVFSNGVPVTLIVGLWIFSFAGRGGIGMSMRITQYFPTILGSSFASGTSSSSIIGSSDGKSIDKH